MTTFKKHPVYRTIFYTILIIFFLWSITTWLTQSNSKSNQNNVAPIFNESTSTDQETSNRKTIILPTPSSISKEYIKNNDPETTKGDSKPFWTNTENVQVCKVPYYTSEDCYNLDVTLVNNTTAKVFFLNGGYKITGNLTCYKGVGRSQEPKYILCRSWDSDNQQWDFIPAWVNLH